VKPHCPAPSYLPFCSLPAWDYIDSSIGSTPTFAGANQVSAVYELNCQAQAGERQSTQRQAEVTQRYIEEVRDEQQVHDDAPEPKCDDISSDARLERDQKDRHDLDGADCRHESVTADWAQFGDGWRQVHIPINQ